jgi:hypothetical protein
MKQRKALSVEGWSPDLPEAMTTISQFNWEFTIDEPSIFRASGHIDCHHRGVYGTKDKAVMVAMRLLLNGSQIRGSVTGCNIVGTEQHYGIMPVHANVELQAGTYTVALQARSASTTATGKNGLAEIKGGYNEVVYEVESL